MLSFETLNTSEELKNTLSQYKVDFVFQPIFSRSKDVIGYEALMRPEGKNIMQFIDEMKELGKLHDLELLTFFGATLAYKQRNYDVLLSINSFPEDAFSEEEALEYALNFSPIKEKIIIEILEYTEEKHWTWELKKKHLDNYRGMEVALDDFGTGYNDFKSIDYYNPNMIKLDRTLISGIDKDVEKQNRLSEIIEEMHTRKIVVLAEGVETKEEYDYLFDSGIDFFQGYYLGRPS